MELSRMKKKKGRDTSVKASDVLRDHQESTSTDDQIETTLSIHPSWNIPAEKAYVYRFMNQQLPPLKPNQVSLSGIEWDAYDDGIIIEAFIRQSLDQAIQLETATLQLLGPNDELLGRKTFDFSSMGALEPKTSCPWQFDFDKASLYTDDLPKEGWKLVFEMQKPHELHLDEAWEKSLADEDKDKMKKWVQSLEPPKNGEINFMGIKAEFGNEDALHITLLIRNGSLNDVNISSLPLQIVDAADEVIVEGGFNLNDFTVKANTSKPWTFIFPKSLIKKDNPDLSRWKAQLKQK